MTINLTLLIIKKHCTKYIDLVAYHVGRKQGPFIIDNECHNHHFPYTKNPKPKKLVEPNIGFATKTIETYECKELTVC
jgi:hypothetical protein